ncbi:MAG: hypothetical protein ABIG95_06460 [Candidatus Woesearchaeota archaeon]
MKFTNTFSTKQIRSVFWIITALILFTVEPGEAYGALRTVALFIIVISVLEFWYESIKRYKILVPYKKNKYDSNAEEKIAAYFKRKNIIFHHHPEIRVPKTIWIFSIPFINIRIEPDFFLPEFDVFVEYWGRIDDPEYKKKSYDPKKRLYKDNVLDLISLYPKNMDNLDFVFTSKLLDLIKEKEGNLRRYR